MKEEEKALTEKVSSFYKAFAPTKVESVLLEADIILPDNDVDSFIRVVMSFNTNEAPKFPVFVVDHSGVGCNFYMVWFLNSAGYTAMVKIDHKYLKEVKEVGG